VGHLSPRLELTEFPRKQLADCQQRPTSRRTLVTIMEGETPQRDLQECTEGVTTYLERKTSNRDLEERTVQMIAGADALPSSEESSTYSSMKLGHLDLVPLDVKPKCTVIYKSWSLCSLVLKSLQFHVTQEFDSSRDAVSVKSIETSLVFMTGKWVELTFLWQALGPTHQLLAFLELGSSPLKSTTGFWQVASHVDYDGVTDGRWWWGSSFDISVRVDPVVSPRRLCHVLLPLPKGRPYKPLAGVDVEHIAAVQFVQGFCHPLGLFPVSRPQALVLAPSVFTKWTTRHLTLKEVFECWDIPIAHAAGFSSTPPSHYSSLPFIKSTPAKVIYGVISSLLIVLRPPPPMWHEEPSVKPQVQSLSPPHKPTDSNGALMDCLQLNPPEGRQRAAKDDDAVIPFHLWDGPFWNYLLQLGCSANFLISASQQLVGWQSVPILDVLRGFVLRVWRLTVFKSFRRFMKQTYGPLWFAANNLDISGGRDCLQRVAGCTFWDWQEGSSLFFW
jgi:hypothetical protein